MFKKKEKKEKKRKKKRRILRLLRHCHLNITYYQKRKKENIKTRSGRRPRPSNPSTKQYLFVSEPQLLL